MFTFCFLQKKELKMYNLCPNAEERKKKNAPLMAGILRCGGEIQLEAKQKDSLCQ